VSLTIPAAAGSSPSMSFWLTHNGRVFYNCERLGVRPKDALMALLQGGEVFLTKLAAAGSSPSMSFW